MKYLRQIAILLAVIVAATPYEPVEGISAKTVKLTKHKINIVKGKTTTLKVKGTKKKAKWSIKSGKKYIKLQKKRKASVKVKALKVGTAKVQCKIGKKKLVCKVTVKTKKIKPQVTPQISSQPVVLPTTLPSQTAEPTKEPMRTHVPTENRLMAEPVKSTLLPASDENGLPIDYVGGARRYYFFGSDISRTKIEEIRFADRIEIPVDAIGTMDLSERQNQSVMAWYMDRDMNGRYEMVVAQEGGVVANPNSSYLLCEIGWVTGMEHLYTSEVEDMSYMFFNFGLSNSVKQGAILNLGDCFDTSKVKNMNYMFYEAMPLQQATIRLGKSFVVNQVRSSLLAFADGAYGMATYILPCEELRNWILDSENYCVIRNGAERNFQVESFK